MAKPFFIRQVWPGQSDGAAPVIKTGEFDSIVWIPDGPNRPSIDNFNPPGFLSTPQPEGAKRVLAQIVQKPSVKTRITYDINGVIGGDNLADAESGTTTAQLELEPDSNAKRKY